MASGVFRLILAATVFVLLASCVGAEPLLPNELGRIMIVEYHKIDYPEERWTGLHGDDRGGSRGRSPA